MNKRIAILSIALLVVALPLYSSNAQAQISEFWPAGTYGANEGVHYGYPDDPSCEGPYERGTTALEIYRKVGTEIWYGGSWKDAQGNCHDGLALRNQAARDSRACKNYVYDNLVIEERTETGWRLGSTNGDGDASMTTADIPHDEEMQPEASQAAHPGLILIAKIGGRVVLQQAASWLWRDIQRVQMEADVKRMICGHGIRG
ncbi:MAG: hypothetical protein OXM59_00105 [Gammaproteobacteria bacterium]|nr:hypothetical protein [Gammaproteobacteria bacterium]